MSSMHLQRSAIVAALLLVFHAQSAYAACSKVTIHGTENIFSDTVSLHQVIGGKIKPVKQMTARAFAKGAPFKLEDCEELPGYLIWRQGGKPYLVERSKFTCIQVRAAGASAPQRPAGTPGSDGKGNSACPEKP